MYNVVMGVVLALVILFTLVSPAPADADENPASGISRSLAESRSARISNLRYELHLWIEKLAGEAIVGRNIIRLDLTDNAAPLTLDFATSPAHVKRLEANGRPATFKWVNGHIVVAAEALKTGANEVSIDFTAGDASLNRSPDFLYALFVPARAHLALPVFDQPDVKAKWTLRIYIPPEQQSKWQVVSNGVPDDRSWTTVADRPGPADASLPRQRNAWAPRFFAETELLPTYLFSFVVGDFTVETAERNGRTFRMFHRETDAAKVARNREAIFDLHARALAYMEQYTGIRYVFGKFDFVLIPAFQFGGMEHAGKILYNAPGLLLDESATQNQHLGRASVIAHETAHMWFGDLVTMRWFDDVWMKEVFANFMAAKIVNPSFPEVNHDLRFLLAHYPAAYEVDRTSGANPIRQPLENLNEAGSLYGAIIYQKAPIVMRHLESLMGETGFRDGLREYLRTHAFGNATWLDLVATLDERTAVDLQAWSRVWVQEPGRPTVATELEVTQGRIARLAFTQRDVRGRSVLWPQQLRVELGYPEGPKTLAVDLSGTRVEVPEAVDLGTPLYVLPAGDGWAYGAFEVDPPTLHYLTESLAGISDPVSRGSAWIVLWDAMLAGRVAPSAVADLALAALPREADEQLVSRVLGYLSNVWWRYLSPEERSARIGHLEPLLRSGLDRAGSASQKAAWFNTLRDTAATADTVTWLQRVWEQKEAVAGLTLAEPDFATLALELAVREVAGWRDILQRQHARMENPDRKARFAFVMPALSADAAERAQWFESLANVQNRRREPWVLEGLTYLHHPLRADVSVQYIPNSLEMLHEIQRTGDIFFPKRWLDATLSGHRSKTAAGDVLAFLKRMPADYPPRLRAITLQSSDELFRAAGLPLPQY
ncbi:MAG: hypothetical protein LC791_17480 [Acidobacteria bacterium]|nr:hypothetical protein [Acidobacteriota bacterium]